MVLNQRFCNFKTPLTIQVAVSNKPRTKKNPTAHFTHLFFATAQIQPKKIKE